MQIVSSKKNERGFVPKEEVKKLLKKNLLEEDSDFSSDMMSDIFDLIIGSDDQFKNNIDLLNLKMFAKTNGIQFDGKNEEEILKAMLSLINKENSNGKFTKAEFIKLRNFLE